MVNTPNLTPNVPTGSVVTSAPRPFGPSAPGTMPAKPTNSVAYAAPETVKKPHTVIWIILLLITLVLAVTFGVLFAWKYTEWEALSMDLDGRVDAALALAVAENTAKLEEEFAEREKYPYKTFAGPADYGSLTFEYPQTWSVYIAKDAATGGDFEAYMNPLEVQPVNNASINALRVIIRDQAFDNVVRTYESLVRSGRLSLSVRVVGGTTANLYVGELPNGIRGMLVAFKLRDKTVLLQTDAEIFATEFYALLDTVKFIE